MEAWLLTWNPKYYDWEDPEDEGESISLLQKKLSANDVASMTWSCGSSKRIKSGDRVFIMRLGIEPKGIVASGYACSEVYELPHWDPIKAAAGEWKRYIDIRFDKIRNPETEEILPLQLLRMISPVTHWTPISSGMHLQEEIVKAVDGVWMSL